EVARSTDERARARSLYRQVADQQSDTVWRVRALQEMADMAAEDQDGAAVITITRELLGALPPSHPAAPEVRLSLVAALLGVGDIEEAAQICKQAVSAAPNNSSVRSAQVACAEVDERAGAWSDALEKYNIVLQSDAPPDVLTDAALGTARCAFGLETPAAVIAPIDSVLQQAESPELRLPLLAMKIRALRMLEDNTALQKAIVERDVLAEEVPEIAWNAFVEAAGQSRTAGDSDTSIALLRRVLDLPITSEQRATVLVELGHSHLDLSAIADAKARFEQVVELTTPDTPEAFYAGMGLAEIDRRNEQPKEALARLESLTPPDEQERRTWMAAKATVLSESGDPLAQEAWEALVIASEADADTRYTALKGQADSLVAQDRPTEAIPLFEEARRIATEGWQAGWAGIGLAGALAEANDVESAITLLDELREHPDPEVAMQSMLKRSQLASDTEDWQVAIRVLKPKAAIKLGPAWDATATQARTRALAGAGDIDGASAAWKALANRWPDEEEAILPAWLGLAELAQSIGDDTEAHRWARRAFKEARDPGYRQRARSLVRSLTDPE
ncbi:MAG: tetratricopeptide repeat protein, partial [Myxococcota bacterium]